MKNSLLVVFCFVFLSLIMTGITNQNQTIPYISEPDDLSYTYTPIHTTLSGMSHLTLPFIIQYRGTTPSIICRVETLEVILGISQFVLMDYRSGYNPPSMAAYRRTVLMHEYGHHIDIIDRDYYHREIYCSNIYCCMHGIYTVAGYNTNEAPWYCAHHWSQNDFPGW